MSIARMHNDGARAFGALRPLFRSVGGPVFSTILLLTAVFVLYLFDQRAEKIFSLPQTAAEASAEDLVAFFRTSDMLAEGRAAETYVADRFRDGLAAHHQGMLWLNPPHAFFLVAPLSGADYGAVKAAVIALTALSLFLIARMAGAPPLTIAALVLSPAAFASVLVMQSGALVALGLLAALRFAATRPIAAGFILAVLTVKPQYGLMAPVFLAASGHWRAFGSAAGFTALFAALSVAFWGAAPWAAFIDSAAGGAIRDHAGTLHRDWITIAETVGKLDGDKGARAAAQIATVAIAAAAVFFSARRQPKDLAIGLALLASAIASPSLWVYDWPIVCAGLLMLTRVNRLWPAHLQLLAGLVWIGPLYSLGLLTKESSLIAPVLLALALAAFWLWGERLRGRFEAPSSAPASSQRPFLFQAPRRRPRDLPRPI
ncbi:MAG: glycosyltransferase family 87 protein [Pseudomonadota bacterium]